jgi:hypothetical protein
MEYDLSADRINFPCFDRPDAFPEVNGVPDLEEGAFQPGALES